jgi:hypothetical protein
VLQFIGVKIKLEKGNEREKDFKAAATAKASP